LKCGALNLMMKFVDEKELMNKEAVLGALSSFLRAENFNSKREFVGKMAGLNFLTTILKEKKYSARLIKKCMILMYDLALNDDNIFEETPKLVRENFADNAVERLIEILVDAGKNLDNAQLWDTRTYSLNLLLRIFQVRPALITKYTKELTELKLELAKKLQTCEVDHQELFMKEIKLVEKVENAQNIPIEINYKKENISKISQGDLSEAKIGGAKVDKPKMLGI